MTIGYGAKDFKNMSTTLSDFMKKMNEEESSGLNEIVEMLDLLANGLDENQEIYISNSRDIPETFVR